MSIAVFLGYGPDVDFLLAARHHLPPGVTLFRVNVRGLRNDPEGLELANPIAVRALVADLKARKITTVVTIGSMGLHISTTNHLLRDGGSMYELFELLRNLRSRSTSSDSGRLHIHSKLGDDFHFPRVIDLLPFLFSPDDVSVSRRDDLCDRALADPASYQKDATVRVGDIEVKVFRVGAGASRNLINRRLDPGKLRKYYETEDIKHYFFDRNRTTVVGLDEMKSYAREKGLTLQSFIDEN
jgi:hypothetical protein